MNLRRIGIRLLVAALVLTGAAGWLTSARETSAQNDVGAAIAAAMKDAEVVDLTVLVSEQLPAHWPTHAPFQRWTFNWFKPIKGPYGDNLSQSVFPYYGQRYVIDEHTGTQMDCPAHFIPPEDSGMPFAGPMGKVTCDKVSPAQWMGPAAVIDVRSILDQAPNGKSPIITPQMVRDWEARNGALRPGDIVVFYSGYSDRYYKPFPDGNRLAFEPLILQNKPGWPAPSPETMEYLNSRSIKHVGSDGPSMGPVEGGQATHVAGLKHGMTWDELLTNVGRLPARGAFYVSLPTKIVDGSGATTRVVGIKARNQKGVGG
ncbi:MAG TPA: cyclase family protein [Candidatus Tectomicrobia bacterium]|nr:cyclase family protein [Candidatus Tectomicrobia bacterium]